MIGLVTFVHVCIYMYVKYRRSISFYVASSLSIYLFILAMTISDDMYNMEEM